MCEVEPQVFAKQLFSISCWQIPERNVFAVEQFVSNKLDGVKRRLICLYSRVCEFTRDYGKLVTQSVFVRHYGTNALNQS